MAKMRFGANPKLATVTTAHFDRYVKWLKGPQVWNFVVKGRDGVPVSCPHIGIVTDYDIALREKQAKSMNAGHDFQVALQNAMADQDLRMQKFMGPFTCEVTSSECKALTAPGISDIFPQLQKGVKRAHFAAIGDEQRSTGAAAARDGTLSKGQLKRARAQVAKQKKAAEEKTKQAQRDKAAAAAAAGGAPNKGRGKGGKIIGKGAGAAAPAPRQAPPGCRDRDENGKSICFAFNEGRCTRGDSCRFAHVSWKIPAAGAAPVPGAGVGALTG